MPLPEHVPFTRVGLDQLASALNISSARLFVSPATSRMEIAEIPSESQNQEVETQQEFDE